LRLRYTVTAGATGPATPLFQTLARLINRVEIIVAGRDTVQAIPGYLMALRANYEHEGIPGLGMEATVVTTGSNTATSYDVMLPVDFILPLGYREDDCAIDTSSLTQLSCVINWGRVDGSDLFTTPNSAAISNVTLDVEGQYITNPFRDANTGAAVSSVSGKPYLVRHLDFQEIDVSATNTAMGVILDSRTGMIDLSFMLLTLADGVGVDTVINALSLDAGSFNYLKRDGRAIKAENLRELALTNGLIAGAYYIDPRFGGSVNNAINSAELTGDLKLTADVTKQGTVCKLIIQREAVRPLQL